MTLPYYYRFKFATAEAGDFEFLVGKLKPRAVDPRVGGRDMYVGNPGAGITSPSVPVLRLEGALRAPETQPTAWPNPVQYPDPFQSSLATLVNKADDYQQATPNGDPVITPPLYGCWHAMNHRLSTAQGGGVTPYAATAKWLNELNLDPRHRAAAGLGVRVVQARQEEFMEQAWAQVGDVRAANAKIRQGQLAAAASNAVYARNIVAVPIETRMTLTAPVHTRMLGSDITVAHKIKQSTLAAGLLSPAVRRAMRPRGPFAARAFPKAAGRPQTNLLQRVNTGQISPAPLKPVPPTLSTLASIADGVRSPLTPSWLLQVLKNNTRSWLLIAALVVAAVATFALGLVPLTSVNLAIAAAAVVAGVGALAGARAQAGAQSALQETSMSVQAIQSLPANANFRVTKPGEKPPASGGTQDSVEAARFKTGLTDFAALLADGPPAAPARARLNMTELGETLVQTLDPFQSIPLRFLNSLRASTLLRETLEEKFTPVMAYPKFEQPMYAPLRDISTDLLIPNMNLIPNDTIAILEENRKFIEAYMLGLNFEFARELLWREYDIVDQRGSYFRQFWDVRGVVQASQSTDLAALAESLRDIKEIHLWPMASDLGVHRVSGAVQGDRMVLLVRGSLLSAYPDVVVSARRAVWQTNANGTSNKNKPRRLAVSVTDADYAANEKYPLFSASVSPDLIFLGFDLSVEQARGIGDDPGWFIAFQERQGQPRFGADIGAGGALPKWQDFTWGHISATSLAGEHISLPATALTATNAVISDETLVWSAASSAAHVASILYQDPVLVAVHAEEMLPS